MFFNNLDQVYLYFHENAKQLIGQWLQKDRQNKGWICPVPGCGNGSGEDGDGLVYNPNAGGKGRFHCFVCGFNGDLIDLIGEVYGITDPLEKAKKACDLFNFSYDFNQEPFNSVNNAKNDFKNVNPYNETQQKQPEPVKKQSDKPDRKEAVLRILTESLEGKPGDFSNLFKKAHSQINNLESINYIKGRGITEGNPLLKYMGYLENHDCGIRYGTKNFKGCIAFFTGNNSYCVRDIYPVPPELKKTQKPSNKNQEHPDIPFGLIEVIKHKDKTLEGTEVLEPVFICEGLFDAPSIAEAGAEAIALNGNGNIKPVIWAFQEYDIKRPLLLVLDNDNGGDKGLKSALRELEKTDIKYTVTQFCPKGSDPNQFLTDNRELFIKTVQEYQHSPVKEFEESLNKNKRGSLEAQLMEKSRNPGIKTGFKTLDGNHFLDGGLYPGLYIIGAISSLGKTTFTLQLADQIAKSGKDVMFFSLEMPEIEIMGKSLSRYTLKGLIENGELKPGKKPDSRAKTLYDIYKNYPNDTDGIIKRAMDNYFSDTGEHLRIIEGIGSINAEDIEKEIEKHIKHTGNTPVVFIDYLQLLIQPRDKKHSMTDKQITDANIFKLKKISRDYNTPIFGISSFNRENYNEPVSMKSFKESGAIEYSSDVLIGLEPEYMEIEDNTKEKKIRKQARKEAKEQEKETGVRTIRLVVLKNRNGWSGSVDLFDYYLKYNCYIEKGNAETFKEFSGINFK